MKKGSASSLIDDTQFALPFNSRGKRKDLIAYQASRPFLKWAGGKGSLIKELLKRVPNKFNRYFEPFLGGGALFFALRPNKAILLDINHDLINAYKVVRDDVTSLIADLKKHYYDREYYLKIRDLDRRSDFIRLNDIEKASRFLFLNRTCFNGLYRVNSKGHFNVPFGRYNNPTIVDASNLRACSKVLQGIDILHGGFESISKRVKKGDFVYLDPPYVPLSKTSSFTSYTQEGFDSSSQEMLAKFCKDLNKRGVKFLLSNSLTPDTLKLYRSFNIEKVLAPRAINSKASKRGAIEEILVRNYK